VPSAIQVTPEAADGGAISKIRDGDIIRVDGREGHLTVLVDAAEWAARAPAAADLSGYHAGVGRELFATFRNAVSTADTGASIFAQVAA
jgi:phosphogluconate dehydratase